ncbi:hypothetical protein [Actinokineospora enzanensis]|uniref:hypothetical protein n=1 Tax=Actinokineospora enzanensis TaxID=155975 RepID=UPI0003635FFA|nr:hypothetical protein [Actinokineospora enzanensis]
MLDGTLPTSTKPETGEREPMPDDQVTVRVVFRSGTPEAPLRDDPAALFVSLDKPVAPGTQEACNALSRPVNDYMDKVYGTGGFGGLGALAGIGFDARSASGHATLRHRPRLNFYYEQVPASSPAEWAVVDAASTVDYDGPAAHDHRLWFGSTAYREAIANAPRVRSRRTPVVINGEERGLVEVTTDGTINALWHVRNIYGEIHDLVLQQADCPDLDTAVAAIVRRFDRAMERDLASRAHAQSDH